MQEFDKKHFDISNHPANQKTAVIDTKRAEKGKLKIVMYDFFRDIHAVLSGKDLMK